MPIQAVLDPKSWAERTFGGVQLHDLRRTRRAVQAATSLAGNPLGSLPAQMHTWKATKALYRLLGEEDVTFAALMQPHVHQTRAQAAAGPVILRVPDTTDIDLSHRRTICQRYLVIRDLTERRIHSAAYRYGCSERGGTSPCWRNR